MDSTHKSDSISVPSSVIVLHELASNSIVLTKRSDSLVHHPGEVCFPGGVWDEQDKSLYDTGIREVYEEIGITGERITLIRSLEPEMTLLGVSIQPWFATIDNIEPFILNKEEVTSLVLVPISSVQNSKNYRDLFLERNGIRFKTCEFVFEHEYIWGATARIMKQLVV